ncbi:hypothetical protein PENTCL1PPCAC_18028 [Pristionchus entomophagus]|uniref:Phosphatidylinositol N-acetylglucosaminyltransferase subunit Q n=1 Tax=Pristionchus entomophagus TaxID=358040 RepID=A0AAV5TNL1_9BILA|nr:hypothetical protein PENTCL1PPCAC_18028 [Pristionchus entomophagus]
MIDLASVSIFWESHCATYRIARQKLTEGKGRSLLLDTLIGVAVLVAVAQNSSPIADNFWAFADNLIGELDRLITWLTNNPVGLKLNEPLNIFLARFFHYHIYLWQAFITLSRMAPLGTALLYSLLLGFSVSVALFADFCSLLTLHIFCFEVYANRLGRVTGRALIASWRLLRGKKWNPLRERVDSVSLDSRELFVATCLAIILLFVIFTVSVYFVVFTTLATGVRLIISLLHWYLHTLSKTYVYTIRLLDR